jgi:hypothetical protein
MNERELIQIIEKCRSYEKFIQKSKIDMSYIKNLKKIIKDYSEMVKVLPDKNDSSFELADQKLE